MNNPRAVIGTNSWGSAAYEKIIRGSVVDNDTLKEAMKTAVKSFVDSARDYGFGKGPKLIGMCCPGEIKISSKYTPFTKFKPGQVRESVDKDLKDFGRTSIEVYWLHMPNDIPQYMAELIELYQEGKIENIGVSNFNLQECKIAKSILDKAGIPLFGVQNHYIFRRTLNSNKKRHNINKGAIAEKRAVAPDLYHNIIPVPYSVPYLPWP